jgi:hypothetical protein
MTFTSFTKESRIILDCQIARPIITFCKAYAHVQRLARTREPMHARSSKPHEHMHACGSRNVWTHACTWQWERVDACMHMAVGTRGSTHAHGSGNAWTHGRINPLLKEFALSNNSVRHVLVCQQSIGWHCCGWGFSSHVSRRLGLVCRL